MPHQPKENMFWRYLLSFFLLCKQISDLRENKLELKFRPAAAQRIFENKQIFNA